MTVPAAVGVAGAAAAVPDLTLPAGIYSFDTYKDNIDARLQIHQLVWRLQSTYP